MKREEILAELAALMHERGTLSTDSNLKETDRFSDDLSFDSLDMVELGMDVETKFNIKIPETDLADIKTVGQVIDKVASKS